MKRIVLPKIRWKTVRTVYICRTLALFVGGATPAVSVEAAATAHKPPPERVVVAGISSWTFFSP